MSSISLQSLELRAVEDSVSVSTRRDGEWGRRESKEDPRLWTLWLCAEPGWPGLFSGAEGRTGLHGKREKEREAGFSPVLCRRS